jgi:hypothetical protein
MKRKLNFLVYVSLTDDLGIISFEIVEPLIHTDIFGWVLSGLLWSPPSPYKTCISTAPKKLS